MTKKKQAAKKPKEKKAGSNNWYPAYKEKLNAKRRDTYAKDEAYRQERQDTCRENYRRANHVGGKDCRAMLPMLKKLGNIRYIYVGKKQVKALTFSYRELANALDYSLVAVYRMANDGRIPKAVSQVVYGESAAIKPCGEFVYTEAEARAIINVLGQHQEKLLYYGARHTETKAAMLAAVKAVRKGK